MALQLESIIAKLELINTKFEHLIKTFDEITTQPKGANIK